ncbi:MAG: hypothetical protein QM647_03945 [Asticcacaulis sp.]|uniref:hypothetical protein n=1 Tax=Asticcacaulis sp. TaxID=1872648 RepID=UPI0039E5A5D4
MVLAASTPPAVHAPAEACADYTPVNLHVLRTTIATSPDCRWAVVVVGSEDIEAGQNNPTPFKLPKLTEETENAFVIERATGKITYRFEMVRSASLHWLKDNRHLIINYFEGSGTDIPLLFVLKPSQTHNPVKLSELVWPSVLKRAGIPYTPTNASSHWVYHYYVNFIEDKDERLLISAQPWYTQKGDEGPGIVKCYIYSISKATLRYRFVREDNIDNCPRNPDEKWN